MRTKFLSLALIAILALPALASAAPSGTVVVAQGVDPTTLDPQNHQVRISVIVISPIGAS